MSFPFTDYFSLQKAGLLEVCYTGHRFTICRVAQWAYMAVTVLEDTTMDEDEESRMTIAAWHIDCELGKKIMADNTLFVTALFNEKTGRSPDLVTTVRYSEESLLDKIRNEVRSGLRKPILDPGLDRIFKEQQTQRLKVFLDKYGENPQFSPKKVWPGMLMLLLYPLGLPFFYFNKPLWGIIMLASLVIGCILPVLIIPAGLLGCVLIVMTLIHVLGNHAKDKEGRMICTTKNQKLILDSIATYKKNLAELKADHADV